MITFFMIIQFLVTILLIAGMMMHVSNAEGLGSLGGSTDLFRGSSTKGIEGLLEKWVGYLAWTFLAISFLSAVLVPKFF